MRRGPALLALALALVRLPAASGGQDPLPRWPAIVSPGLQADWKNRERQLAWAIAQHRSQTGLLLLSPDGRRRREVRSCAEYSPLRKAGWGPLDNANRSLESWFLWFEAPERFLRAARPSRTSHLDLARDPLALWRLLYSRFGLDESTPVRGRVTRLERNARGWLDVEGEHEGEVLDADVLALGDLDGDGLEDALVMVSVHVTQGTFCFYQVVILRRRSAGGPLEIAPW